jgi:DNA-binding NtrC family response regulator
MRNGATDFVAKPWSNEKVVATMSAAVQLHRSRVESASLRSANRVLADAAVAGGNMIIGDSIEMRDVLSLVAKAAPTDVNVLILGENGTGKELIARELHRQSSRSDRIFLSVDMGSISESLFESELFGHRKGAFTGANEDRPGRFQAANGGTLFLDEIGNLPLHLQAKLLGALEQRRVTPLGSDKAQAIDVRVISATNASMEALADANRFRQDLLFRLNTVEITLPPLRERIDDILPIATHFAGLYSRKYNQRVRAFSPAARAALIDYDWPGNVRALRHAIERAVILTSNEYLEPADLQLRDSGTTQVGPPAAVTAPGKKAEPAAQSIDQLETATALASEQSLEQIEKAAIEKSLRKHGFNISHTAQELRLTRASLYRRMQKHGI